jgi:hypothetical protein
LAIVTRGQGLECDLVPGLDVPGPVDHAHPTTAQFTQQFVVPQALR